MSIHSFGIVVSAGQGIQLLADKLPRVSSYLLLGVTLFAIKTATNNIIIMKIIAILTVFTMLSTVSIIRIIVSIIVIVIATIFINTINIITRCRFFA